ncbi:polysaccharide biosynthesis tyrosine autokinase (plasmid) [Cetobacterium somerae]|uniref:polysaccharide biosynthesis tyrosine autokinase n=1 Tax=Cetobacterium somerae TaxID=188913 RepID=UPI003D766882
MKRKDDFYEEDFYESDDEVDLKDLLFTLFRRWKLIVLIGAPIFILGVFFAATRPTIYMAEMTMMISNGRNISATSLDGGELSVNQKLTTTYSEIARSKTILKNVIKKYDLETSLIGLKNSVTIDPVEDTELIKLTYKNEDPILAAAIVNEIGNEFMLKVRGIMNFQNIKVIEQAEIPTDTLPKKRMIILFISFALSIMIGCAVALLIEFFFFKLRKEKDIEKVLGVSSLGTVENFEKEEDIQNKQLFFKNFKNHKINESFRNIRTKLHFLNEKESSRTILITSTVSKEGKTLFALNYAMSLAIAGKKVLFIDCDIRESKTQEIFGFTFNRGLESVLSRKCGVEDVILKNVENNLDIIPTKNISNNVTELFLGDEMSSLLEKLEKDYNTIILDTPSLSQATDAAILSKYCDGVVYIVAYNQLKKKELEYGESILNNAKANVYGFVLNKVDESEKYYLDNNVYWDRYKIFRDNYNDKKKSFKIGLKNLLKNY